MMIFKNCEFYNDKFEKQNADIRVENGIIKAIENTAESGKDMSGYTLIPGFIDIHIHGAAGSDASDADEKVIDKISTELAKHGVTSFCPTTMTLPTDRLQKAVSAIKSYKEKGESGAKIAGINLEGPYISEKKKGSQNAAYIRPASEDEFKLLYSKSGKLIKLITIAPEAFESEKFIKFASGYCTVSIGHSSANAKQCKAAIENGITHATHLFNAMTQSTHRNPGIAGTVLDDERVYCEVICDGGHICPEVLRSTFKILGSDRGVVISDSMRAAGLGEGVYELGGQQVFVKSGGKYAILSDGTIAASISNMHDEFKYLISIGIDFKTALKSCTLNPAKSIGIEKNIGSIAVGKAADFVFLDKNMNIKEVYINGILA